MALILCIDDDLSVAQLIAEMVESKGHEPVTETDPVDAVQRWIRSPKIVAVLTDFMMPKLDGVELLSAFMEARPEVRRVLITAAPHEDAVRRAKKDGVIQMLIAKPPSFSDIKQALLWL